jgi:hypothetical protein
MVVTNILEGGQGSPRAVVPRKKKKKKLLIFCIRIRGQSKSVVLHHNVNIEHITKYCTDSQDFHEIFFERPQKRKMDKFLQAQGVRLLAE